MLKIIISLSTFLVGALAQSQVSESRNTEAFTKISVKGVEVSLSSSAAPSMRVEAADALSLGDVVTEVRGTTLFIYCKDKLDAPAKVVLSVSGLESIECRDARVSVADELRSDQLEIDLASRAIFCGNLRANRLRLVLRSGSVINSAVTARELYSSVSGKSKAALGGWVKTANLASSNGSVCEASRLFTDRLSVSATQASTISATTERVAAVEIDEDSTISWNSFATVARMPENAVVVAKSAL